MRAASLLGPKQTMPAARTASATPSTSGTSGPMTTRSARTLRASATTSSPEVTVDVVLLGQPRGAGVARGDDQTCDLRVSAERQQQGMFTGTGTDHQDAHETSLYRHCSSSKCARQSGGPPPLGPPEHDSLN